MFLILELQRLLYKKQVLVFYLIGFTFQVFFRLCIQIFTHLRLNICDKELLNVAINMSLMFTLFYQLNCLVIVSKGGLAPEVIKLISCSTQLSTKFQLLMSTKILTNEDFSCSKSLRCCIDHANKLLAF